MSKTAQASTTGLAAIGMPAGIARFAAAGCQDRLRHVLPIR